MALVLTLKVGDDFYVKDSQVFLEAIHSHNGFALRRMRDNALIEVTAGKAYEIFKGVFVSAGARGQIGLARVSIEAPRTIPLLRGYNYRHPLEQDEERWTDYSCI